MKLKNKKLNLSYFKLFNCSYFILNSGKEELEKFAQ